MISTGLDHIPDDGAIPMVCMYILCVGMQCKIPALDQPTVLYTLYSTVSSQQKTLPKTTPFLPRRIYCIYRTTSQCLSSYGCTITVLYIWQFGFHVGPLCVSENQPLQYRHLNCDMSMKILMATMIIRLCYSILCQVSANLATCCTLCTCAWLFCCGCA